MLSLPSTRCSFLHLAIWLFASASVLVLGHPGADDSRLISHDESVLNAQKVMDIAFKHLMANSSQLDVLNWADSGIIGCLEKQNFTLHVGNSQVVYTEGIVKALPNVDPIVWTLITHPSSSPPTLTIIHQNPWGKEVHWTSGWRVGISTSSYDFAKLSIKYIQGSYPSPKIVISTDNGDCLHFDKDGIALLASNAFCQPISVRMATPTVWKDATAGEECTAKQLGKVVKAVQDELDRGDDVTTTGVGEVVCGVANKVVDGIGCALGFGKACGAAAMWRPDHCT